MQENDVWYDQEGTCTLYKCIRENVGPSNVQMHTLSYPGTPIQPAVQRCKEYDNKQFMSLIIRFLSLALI